MIENRSALSELSREFGDKIYHFTPSAENTSLGFGWYYDGINLKLQSLNRIQADATVQSLVELSDLIASLPRDA